MCSAFPTRFIWWSPIVGQPFPITIKDQPLDPLHIWAHRCSRQWLNEAPEGQMRFKMICTNCWCWLLVVDNGQFWWLILVNDSWWWWILANDCEYWFVMIDAPKACTVDLQTCDDLPPHFALVCATISLPPDMTFKNAQATSLYHHRLANLQQWPAIIWGCP